MVSKYSAAFKLTALVLVLSIGQLYVLADSGRALFGQLATSGNSIITVNNQEASSGTTILSGAQLQTPLKVTASVLLNSLGRVEMEPETSLALNFSRTSVDVVVTKGAARLTTNKGIKGSITFDGKTELTDPAKDSSTASGGASTPKGDDNDNSDDNGPSFGHILELGVPIITGSILLAVYVPCRRGRNPSPGVPRGRNDDCRRGF